MLNFLRRRTTLPASELPQDGPEFVVVDVETTGLYATDRVVEIALVRVDAQGELKDEFETLVNPRRDVGATQIHGLTASHLAHAPAFEQIASQVRNLIEGRILAAHNALFDTAFLEREFKRCGVDANLPAVCTMQLPSRLGLPVAGRSLHALCRHFEVEHRNAHDALDDARATARCLVAMLQMDRQRTRPLIRAQAAPVTLPGLSVPDSASPVSRQTVGALIATERTYLSTLVERISSQSFADDDLNPYLDLLDRALLDRHISRSEAEALHEHAVNAGLSGARVREAHRAYFDALLAAAWEDGKISRAEREDLNTVGEYLGLKRVDIERALSTPTAFGPADSGIDLQGKSVCFTGTLRATIGGRAVTRADAEALALQAGAQIAKGVTKKLDYLVVADAQSLSGKAEKARQYGTTIVAESVFWRAIGVNVD